MGARQRGPPGAPESSRTLGASTWGATPHSLLCCTQTPQSSLGTACAGASPCSQLPGDTCIDTAEMKIRHSEELRFSPFYRPDSGPERDKLPGHFGAATSQGSGTGDPWGAAPSPSRTPGAGTRAALHRLNPRLDHFTSAFPSQGKAPRRSEQSGAAGKQLGASHSQESLVPLLKPQTPRFQMGMSLEHLFHATGSSFGANRCFPAMGIVPSLTRARGRAKGNRTRALKTQTDTSVFIIFHLLCTIEI